MKKSLLLAAVLLLASVATQAQHKMWVSGSAGVSSEKTDEDNADPFVNANFSPAFGYNLNANWTLGLAFNYSTSKANDDNKSSEFNVNPFVRDSRNVSDKVVLYGEGDVRFGSMSGTSQGVDYDGVGTFGLGIAPGIQYLFSDRWSINADIGILSYDSEDDKDAKVKTNKLNFGLDFTSLNFALNYHFGAIR